MDEASPATSGSFGMSVADLPLEPVALDPVTIVEGVPEVTERLVWESEDGRDSRGVWQITPGVVTDVEANELFVVISGRATIEIQDGPTIEVGPGDLCVLQEGARTVWRVHETLRKVFAITGGA